MTRRIVAWASAVSLAGVAAVAGAPVAAATPGAPTATCEQYMTRTDPVTQQPTVVCVQWSEPPGRDNGADDGEGGNSGGDEGGDPCWWELYPIPEGVVPDRPAGASAAAVMYWELCLNSSGATYVGPGGAQWFEPVQAPRPSPAQVASQVRVEVVADLRDPLVATDPPGTTPSVATVPTFVAVTNWQGEVVEDGCDPTGAVCVTITATPTLTFDPGEPGAEVVTCEPGGTRYDPAGPPAAEQAAVGGACAHAYRRRTGVDTRPEAWPAAVTITWDVRWQGGGQAGTFADVSATETFERPVDEVRALVVDGTA